MSSHLYFNPLEFGEYKKIMDLVRCIDRAVSADDIIKATKSGDFSFSNTLYSKMVLDKVLEKVSSFDTDDQVRSLESLNKVRQNKKRGFFEFGNWISEPSNFDPEFHKLFISVFGKEKYVMLVTRGYSFSDFIYKIGGYTNYRVKDFPDEVIPEFLIFVSDKVTSKFLCGYKRSWVHKRIDTLVKSLENLSIERRHKIRILSNILSKIVVDVDEKTRDGICKIVGLECIHGKTYRTLGRQLDKAVLIMGVFDE